MTDRTHILQKANQCITVDRAATHGNAEDNFGRIAGLWAVYKPGVEFTPRDAALMLALVKIARAAGNAGHEDNYVDLAGYAALAGEIATSPRPVATAPGECANCGAFTGGLKRCPICGVDA